MVHADNRLKKFSRALQAARSSIDPTASSQLIQAFVAVAMNEGKTTTEISHILGTNLSTASRQLLDLGDRNRKMEPGYGLVDRRTDPMNLRSNNYFLTPRGKLVAEQIAAALED